LSESILLTVTRWVPCNGPSAMLAMITSDFLELTWLKVDQLTDVDFIGPTEAAIDKSWKPRDVEKVK
jgi:hypothetical protein